MNTPSFATSVVRIEYLFAAMLVAIFFITVGHFDWWWIIVLFPLFDISMIGYLVNAHVGSITYNIVHSFVGPAILTAIYIFTTGRTAADETRLFTSDNFLLFVILVWLFHICVDRALGFGLKHRHGFEHTHMGQIGKQRKKSV